MSFSGGLVLLVGDGEEVEAFDQIPKVFGLGGVGFLIIPFHVLLAILINQTIRVYLEYWLMLQNPEQLQLLVEPVQRLLVSIPKFPSVFIHSCLTKSRIIHWDKPILFLNHYVIIPIQKDMLFLEILQ